MRESSWAGAVLGGLWSLSALADGAKPGAEKLRFIYRLADGSASAECLHFAEEVSPRDWLVTCKGPEIHKKREYRVHLWVTPYASPGGSRTRYEILYWVTDWSLKSSPRSHGTTAWIQAGGGPSLEALELSQQVENGLADLVLSWSP